MSLKSLASKVLPFAPLLGTVLGGPGVIAAQGVGLIARAFGLTGDDPAAVEAAIAADPNAAARLAEIQEENRAELEKLVIQAETQRIVEVNKTIRTEIASEDAYVRRARPTFMYVMAATWCLQSLAIFAAVIGALFVDASKAGAILGALTQLMAALTTMWSIAMAVVGVGVVKRSQDKAVAAGNAPPATMLGALAGLIGGKK